MKKVILILLSLIIVSKSNANPECKDLFRSLSNLQMAVLNGMRSLPKSDIQYFYEKDWGLQAVVSQVTGNDIKNSMFRAQGLWTLNAKGGMVLFLKNIFAEGYFRKTRWNNSVNKSTAELALNQPWFEWNSILKKYELKKGSTYKALLTSYVQDGKIKIFRGIDSKEAELFENVKNNRQLNLNNLFTKERDGVFFTPEKWAAEAWSEGYYLELEVDLSSLKDAYVGIEYEYVEIAILKPETIKNAIDTLIIHKIP